MVAASSIIDTISNLLLLADEILPLPLPLPPIAAAMVREASHPIFLRAEAICFTAAGVQPNQRTRPPDDDDEGAEAAAPPPPPLPPRRVWEASVWRRKRPSVPTESLIRNVLWGGRASTHGRTSGSGTALAERRLMEV